MEPEPTRQRQEEIRVVGAEQDEEVLGQGYRASRPGITEAPNADVVPPTA